MIKFKFFQKNRRILFGNVFVDYTIGQNGKSFTSLKFAERDQTENNPNIKVFQGTFLGFKKMIEDNPILDWAYDKPTIHLIAFYSKRFNNCQRLGYVDFFRERRYRFRKDQKLRIYYETI